MDKDYYWFLVVAEVRQQDGDKLKTVKVSALIHATSLTEIDTISRNVFKIFTPFPDNINVVSTKQMDVEKVFTKGFDDYDTIKTLSLGKDYDQTILFFEEDSEKDLYQVQVIFFTLDEKTGKMKKSGKADYYVPEVNQTAAIAKVKKEFENSTLDYKFNATKISKIEAVVEYNTNVDPEVFEDDGDE